MKKKKSNTKLDTIDYLYKSASATDCTGLIPTLPQTSAEEDSYEELYHFRPDVQVAENAKENM